MTSPISIIRSLFSLKLTKVNNVKTSKYGDKSQISTEYWMVRRKRVMSKIQYRYNNNKIECFKNITLLQMVIYYIM